MCDCSQKQHDKTIQKIDPVTVTLFSKCPTPYRPGKNILEYTIPNGSDRMPIDFVQSSSSDTVCVSTKTLSIDTQSSSGSSRIVSHQLEISSINGNAIKLFVKIICRKQIMNIHYQLLDNCSINLFVPQNLMMIILMNLLNMMKRVLNRQRFLLCLRQTKLRRPLKRNQKSNIHWP